MTINYHSLGQDKRMCDVVFAGSHDAGINEGGAPTRAQKDPIAVQAVHGARFFDVRVGAFQSGKKITLKTFHAAEKLQWNSDKALKNTNDNGPNSLETMSLPLGGHSGEKLADILRGARNFVEFTSSSEFLVLIFSKSTNMEAVVDVVDRGLGNRQFSTHGNLNTKTLQQLSGNVVCVYTEDSVLNLNLQSYAQRAGATGPRFGMKNLFKGGTYRDGYNGIQYYGKGGLTDGLGSEREKVDSNAGLQLDKMKAGARVAGHQTMLGMVYVTATGGVGSLKKRDKKLWKDKRINPLLNIWESDEVAGNIADRIPMNVDPTAPNAPSVIKNFFPNIVMMDFTTMQRCQTIFDINRQSPSAMGGAKRTLSRPNT